MITVAGGPENITYVIYSIYTRICITMALLCIQEKAVEEELKRSPMGLLFYAYFCGSRYFQYAFM